MSMGSMLHKRCSSGCVRLTPFRISFLQKLLIRKGVRRTQPELHRLCNILPIDIRTIQGEESVKEGGGRRRGRAGLAPDGSYCYWMGILLPLLKRDAVSPGALTTTLRTTSLPVRLGRPSDGISKLISKTPIRLGETRAVIT